MADVVVDFLARAKSEAPPCPHIAVLIRSPDELPAVLASFYTLGVARNGWLYFGSLPGAESRDRAALAGAGLDVAALEADGRMLIVELDLSVDPAAFVEPWAACVDEALANGYSAVWFARFPVGGAIDDVSGVLPFEAAWIDRLRGRQIVTLCPYIVGGLEGLALERHVADVGHVHDAIVDARGGGDGTHAGHAP